MHDLGFVFFPLGCRSLFLSVAVAYVALPHTLCGLALLHVPLSLHSVFSRQKHALMFCMPLQHAPLCNN